MNEFVLTTYVQKGFRRKQIRLFINGQFHRQIAYKCWINGQGQSERLFKCNGTCLEYINDVLTKGARFILVEALSKRDISERGCIDKLVEMGLNDEHAILVYGALNNICRFNGDERILNTLKEQGYRKGKGVMWYKQKCIAKKIKPDLIQSALNDYIEENAWPIFLKKHPDLDPYDRRKKAYQCGFITLK